MNAANNPGIGLPEILRKNLAQAYINTLYEHGRKAYLCFVASHPEVSFKPMPKASKFSKADVSVPGAGGTWVQEQIATMTVNISLAAVGSFCFDEKNITFECRFDGRLTTIVVPYASIAQIFDPSDHTASFPMNPDLSFLMSSDKPSQPDQPAKELAEQPKPPLSSVEGGPATVNKPSSAPRAKLTLVK